MAGHAPYAEGAKGNDGGMENAASDAALPMQRLPTETADEFMGRLSPAAKGARLSVEQVKELCTRIRTEEKGQMERMDGHTQVQRAPHAWGRTALSWKGINFKVPDAENPEAKRVILQDCWGHVPAGTLVALMGPSGCGKSTLLDILAQKKTTPYDGSVYCNGHDVKGDAMFKRYACYVSQADIMPEMLTVKEMVAFDQLLKNPMPGAFLSDPEMRHFITDMILDAVGLTHVGETVIGGDQSGVRGISGGQKRRVTLARGIVTQNQLIFADEPTSGLSATDAETCVKVLRWAAKRIGATIVVVIHQPRIEVAELFDHLVLLTANPAKYGGSTIYNGPMADAMKHWTTVGYAVPEQVNPTDWYMDTCSPGYKHALVKEGKKEVDESLFDLVKAYDTKLLPGIRDDVEQQIGAPGVHPRELTVKKMEGIMRVMNPDEAFRRTLPDPRPGDPFSQSTFTQFRILFRYKLTLLCRDKAGLRMQFGMAIMQGVLLGIAYYGIGRKSEIQQLQFIYMLLMMGSMGGMQIMPLLVTDRTIMKKEVGEALYNERAWILGNCIINMVVTLTSNSLFLVIVFAFSRVDWDHFGTFYQWAFMVFLVMDSFWNLCAAIARTGQQSQQIAMPGLIMFVIYNGFLVSRETVAVFMVWALYCSPFYYAITQIALALYDRPYCHGAMKTQLLQIQQAIQCNTPYNSTINVDCPGCCQVMDVYGFEGDEGVAWAIMIAIFAVLRIGQVLALMYLNNPEK